VFLPAEIESRRRTRRILVTIAWACLVAAIMYCSCWAPRANASWPISFTAPVHRAGRYTVFDCSMPVPQDTLLELIPKRFIVYRQRQSPTGQANKAALLKGDARSDSLWRCVVAEAAPVLTLIRQTSYPECGQHIRIDMPDTLSLGWFYYVVTVDAKGDTASMSCPGMFR